jgi:hypothetical protein
VDLDLSWAVGLDISASHYSRHPVLRCLWSLVPTSASFHVNMIPPLLFNAREPTRNTGSLTRHSLTCENDSSVKDGEVYARFSDLTGIDLKNIIGEHR